jgi:hypothetical protein
MASDPKACSLPRCPWPANGKDWLLIPLSDGSGNARMGFCSHAHTRLAAAIHEREGLAFDIVIESDPAGNFEDSLKTDGNGGAGT